MKWIVIHASPRYVCTASVDSSAAGAGEHGAVGLRTQSTNTGSCFAQFCTLGLYPRCSIRVFTLLCTKNSHASAGIVRPRPKLTMRDESD